MIAQDEPDADLDKLKSEKLTTFDRGILHKLRAVSLDAESAFYDEDAYGKPGDEPKSQNPPREGRPYDLARAGNALYGFIWSDFADWYLEAAKVQLRDADTHQNTNIILRFVLETSVKLLHPFMPFITETLWQQGLGQKDPLITSAWPELHEDLDQPEDAQRFDEIRNIIETIRRLRAERKTPAGAWIQAYLVSDEPEWLLESSGAINQLARLKILRIGGSPPKGNVVKAVSGQTTVVLPLAGLVDEAAEGKRLQAAVEQAKMKVERLKARLANKHYAEKAPPHVVAETKQALTEAEAALRKLGGKQ